MDQLLNAILLNTYTLQSLHKRLQFLKDYFSARFFNKQGVIFSDSDLGWLQSLGNSTRFLNADNLETSLSELDKKIEKLEQLNLYLAIDLPQQQLDEVVKKIRQDSKLPLLVNVKLDPSLIAGCALAYKGNYKDYSLKKKIEDNKERVVESFKAFIK